MGALVISIWHVNQSRISCQTQNKLVDRSDTMRSLMIANALLLIASTVNAATELSVDLYDGPTDCEDSERVKKGERLFRRAINILSACNILQLSPSLLTWKVRRDKSDCNV